MQNLKPVPGEDSDNLVHALCQPYGLSAESVADYQEQGFIKLGKVLSPEALAFFADEITAKVLELNTMSLPMRERDVYDQAFLQVMNLWQHSARVKQLVMSQRLARIAAALMGSSGVRLYHDQALYKEPSGGITPWHADQHYWPLDSNKTITAWIPLQAVPLSMGPLAFSPGSHKLAQGRDLAISEESEERISTILAESGYGCVESAFALGDVSFHSGWTFHRANANASDAVRAVMTIIYMDEDIRLKSPTNPNQQNDRMSFCPQVRVGDVVNSPLNPVIWSAE